MPSPSPADFDVYLRQSEPELRERAGAWQASTGLQAVDGLQPSAYLYQTARRHIEGDISIAEVRELIDSYYLSKEGRANAATEQADKVSANIAGVLGEQAFTFSPVGFVSLHRRIFDDVFPFAGKLREYNITKKEWVLGGDTVFYTSASELEATLEYDFAQEKRFSFSSLSLDDVIEHIATFIAGLWQIHPFAEGNTRTTAVFAIKYLRSMGFEVGNDMFALHSWFFRNALVRANYRNMRHRVEPDVSPLVRFFRNVLLGEQNPLRNRDLRVERGYPPHEEEVMEIHEPSADELMFAEYTKRSQQKRISEKQAQDKLVSYCSEGKDKQREKKKKEQVVVEEASGLHLRQKRLLRTLGSQALSVPELLHALRLSTRQSFMRVWLTPAMEQGLVKLLHPESPRHPQQKYLLTSKGKRFLKQLTRK